MKTFKTSVVALVVVAVIGAAGLADASELVLIPADQTFSEFTNVVTGKPTESIIPPFGCLLSGETLGHTVIAIQPGAPSREFTVYTNGAISPGDKLSFISVDVCTGYTIWEAVIDEGGPGSWDCLVLLPIDAHHSGFKNVVSGKQTASLVDPPFDASAYGFEGEQDGHTVHPIFKGTKSTEFKIYTNFPILPGDKLEMIQIALVSGYKVMYTIITQ